MSDCDFVDFYEVLQVSSSAEPETIHRVYRLLAQRWHPDNRETGDVEKFRAVHNAYLVLSDPERRAQFDVQHEAQRQTRWKIASSAPRSAEIFELERIVRLTVLEILYMQRLTEIPTRLAIFLLDLEQLLGAAREHVEFTLWYLQQKQLRSSAPKIHGWPLRRQVWITSKWNSARTVNSAACRVPAPPRPSRAAAVAAARSSRRL